VVEQAKVVHPGGTAVDPRDGSAFKCLQAKCQRREGRDVEKAEAPPSQRDKNQSQAA